MTRSIALTSLATLLACGAQPPPQHQPPLRAERDAENEQLRTRVSDLERRLATSEQREKTAAADARASEKLRKIDEKLDEIKKRQPEPAPPARPQRRRPTEGVMYSVPIDGGLTEGPKNALVTMIVASEVACPYCKRVQPTIDQLRKDYKKDLRVVYQSRIVHPQLATDAAQMLCAATRQKKGRKFLDVLWLQYDVYRQSRDPKTLGFTELLAAAKALRLNPKRLDRDMGRDCKAQVERQNKRFVSLGVNGAPSFFINGQFMSGAQPIEKFRTLIDAELSKARDLVKSGLDRKSIYASIVAFGKKEI